MDLLNHFLFGILLVTPFLSPFRLTAKIVAVGSLVTFTSFLVFGLTFEFYLLTGAFAVVLVFYPLYRAWRFNPKRFQLFMFIFSTVILAGLSHAGDIVLSFFGDVPPIDSALRPQNFWHAPIFAVFVSLVIAFLMPRFLNWIAGGAEDRWDFEMGRFRGSLTSVFSVTLLGYLVHIFADSISYDFDIWWAFPFSDLNFSLYDLANSGKELATGGLNPWGWNYFWLTPVLVLAAGIFVLLIYLSKNRSEDRSSY